MTMLTVNEAAERLGVSGARVRKLISNGALAAAWTGRHWLIDSQAVINYRAGTTAVANGVDGYITRDEAARRLGRSLSTISDWITDGRLRSVVLHGRTLVREDDVDTFVLPRRGRPVGGAS